MQEPKKILAELGLSEAEVLVYIALAQGAKSAREVMNITRQRKPTVYYALGVLERRGLVSKSGAEGAKKFFIEPAESLDALLKEKEVDLKNLKADLKAILPILQPKADNGGKKPAVVYFEGVEAVKNVIIGSLYCKGRNILSILPKDNFFWQLGKNFAEDYVSERVRNRIRTRNLWEEPITKSLYKAHYEGVSEVKLLPSVMRGKFATTIFIYDDKTLYISSLKNNYAVLITSLEHSSTMRAIFEGLWLCSDEYPR